MAAVESKLPISAQVVGDAFVQQYYHVFHQSPELLHQFYQDTSTLSRPETNGPTSLTTTMEAIKEKMLSFNSGDFRLEIKSVDAQSSFYEGVHVLVTGSLKWKDNANQYFTQSFFLAPQEKGYFVLNDILRFMGDDTYDNINLNCNPAKDVESLPTPVQNHLPAQETLDSKIITEKEEVLVEEVIEPSDVEQEPTITKEEVPVPEVVNEVPDESVAIPTSKIVDVPKKTYASIVMMMKENAKTFSSPAPVPRKPVMKSQEQVNFAPVSVPLTETPVVSDPTENANISEGEADGCSVYIKGLPPNVTIAQLEEEFKKFGTIKSGGIQIKNNKGFCYGFVEFEVASVVQQAIEASPIVIGGRQVRIDEKKSTISRGSNHRDRYSNGRGHGFRNEGVRGRGFYGGGRGRYNRNDSNGRSEFGNKSGNRGPNRESSGDRPDEDGFVSVKGTATSSTPRVTVTA